MDFVEVQRSGEIATVTLRNGKVNALNGPVVDEFREALKALEGDPEVKALIGVTGGTLR